MVDEPVHRKPIGENGSIRVANASGGPTVTWEKIAYPDKKATQEAMIAEAFLLAVLRAADAKWKDSL